MQKQFFIKLFVILLIVISSGCHDDMNQIEEDLSMVECENISELGEILTLEESKNFLPYPDSISNVIFTNSQGEEFEGKVNRYSTFITTAVTSEMKPCPIDSQIQIQYKWMPERKEIHIQIDTLNILLRASVSPSIYHEDYSQKLVADRCHFILITPIDLTTPNSQMSIIVNQRTHPNPIDSYTEYHDEYQIHGEVYEQVYVGNSNINEEFKLYFSNQIGIVGFKGEINGNIIDLKFDRNE